MSARGGTTGRATGWPAKFGLAGGRSGLPPPKGKLPGAAACGAAGPGRSAGLGGTGIVGTAPGRGAPRTAAPGTGAPGGFNASATSGGRGCRGPERICPGLGGGGPVRAGMTGPRPNGIPGAEAGADGAAPACPRGGVRGCPVASGGRSGNAERDAGAGTGSLTTGSL